MENSTLELGNCFESVCYSLLRPDIYELHRKIIGTQFMTFSTGMKKYYYKVFILFFFTFAYFFQGGGWNQNSKICLVRSIIHHGTFTIDACREDTREMTFANTGDYSIYNGHYYSNKSPGHAFLAVPSFAIAEYIFSYLFPDDPELQIRLSAYISTVFTTVLCSTLLCLLMFRFYLVYFHINVSAAFILTACFGLGTLAFSYSTTFYTHILSAFFLFFAFTLLLNVRMGHTEHQKKSVFFAGLATGMGVLGEPSALYACGFFFLYMLTFRQTRALIPYFILGGMPCAVIQLSYNIVCFGGPLSYSYQFANETVMVKANGRLFGIPPLKVILNLLILPYRGLFVSSPILLMAIPGFFIGIRSRKFTVEVIVASMIAIAFFVFLASYYGWDGGSTVGPRDIIPMFPFLFLVASFSFLTFPKTFTAIGILSVIINLGITIVGNEVPSKIGNPLIDVIAKNLLKGNVSINPFPVSFLEHYTALYPSLYDFGNVEKWQPNFNSFNLGELLFPNSLLSILPLLCFWCLWGYVWIRKLKHTA